MSFIFLSCKPRIRLILNKMVKSATCVYSNCGSYQPGKGNPRNSGIQPWAPDMLTTVQSHCGSQPLGTAHCFSCHCPHLKPLGLWLFPGKNFYKWQLCLLFQLASGRDPAPAISTCKDYSLAMGGELPFISYGNRDYKRQVPRSEKRTAPQSEAMSAEKSNI